MKQFCWLFSVVFILFSCNNDDQECPDSTASALISIDGTNQIFASYDWDDSTFNFLLGTGYRVWLYCESDQEGFYGPLVFDQAAVPRVELIDTKGNVYLSDGGQIEITRYQEGEVNGSNVCPDRLWGSFRSTVYLTTDTTQSFMIQGPFSSLFQ